jgi:hypothetical protein
VSTLKKMLRKVLMAVLAFAMVLTGLLAVSAPAQAATSTITCGSYGSTPSFACDSFSGFNGQRPWGYPVDANGHNCTNYVTYRLWRNGVANPGNLGDAYSWDNNAAAYGFPVNGTPAAGSVAVWEINAPPALGSGHVGFVDSVNSDGSINVSEDNYGGTTMNRRLYPGSNWPSHFVHFKDDQASASGARLLMANTAGQLYAKDSVGVGGWIDQGTNAANVAIGGSRMALINGAGQVYAKDALTGGGWIDQGAIATGIAVGSSGRMMIIVPGGEVYAKDTLGGGGWIDQGATASQIAVGGGRMLLVNTGNQLYAKDTLTGPWNDQGANVTQVSVGSSGLMGIIVPGGKVYAKSSLSNGGWVDQGATASQIAVGGGRIALLNGSGQVYAKDNASSGGGWIDQDAIANSVSVGTNGRMAVIVPGGEVYAKDVLGGGGWIDQDAPALFVKVG